MNNYSKELIQRTKAALAENVNDISVLFALVQLNKAIQDHGSGSEFPTIGLYRDWLVHTNLDRRKRLVNFFKQWDAIFEDIRDGIGINAAMKRAVEPLAFNHLFTELESLGVNLGASDRSLFIKALTKNVLDAPLRWQGRHIKEFRFTFNPETKKTHPTYFCHIQIQHTTDQWFNGPELHYDNPQTGFI